ncbi:hypothetical protein ABDK10_05350 [Staphylococcus aureus]
MRVNNLKDYIVFYSKAEDSPYPGMGGKTKVFESWAEIYEPSTKDIQLSSFETSNVNVTAIVRNTYPEYVPSVGQSFTVQTGMYENTSFNITNIAPKEDNTVKIVGSKIWA